MTPDGDPTHDALLAGVIDDPRADAPRLVYADYLDDRGTDADRERAAFIRAQIQLERLPRDHPDRESLQAFERDVLVRRAHEWAVPFRRTFSAWTYRRGFVEEVWCDLEAPPEDIRAMLRSAPLLVLRHYGVLRSLASVVEVLPDLRHLTDLVIYGLVDSFEREDARRILLSPHLAELEWLDLRYARGDNRIDEDILSQAAKMPFRRNRRERGGRIDEDRRDRQLHRWEDLAVAEADRAAEYLIRRDPDGLEAYCRDLCVRHRGEGVARRIDALPFGDFSRALDDAFRAMAVPPATTILIVAPFESRSLCNFYDMDPLDEDDFRPNYGGIGFNEAYPAVPLPACPGSQGHDAADPDLPLDPDSAGLYYTARRNAAFARAAASAGVTVQVRLMGLTPFQRVW